MNKYYSFYKISADDGKSWTVQYMTEEEAEQDRNNGYIVNKVECFINSNTPYVFKEV